MPSMHQVQTETTPVTRNEPPRKIVIVARTGPQRSKLKFNNTSRVRGTAWQLMLEVVDWWHDCARRWVGSSAGER